MKLEIEVSEETEATAEPWWLIIDPRQMLSLSCHTVASMITGPFFSREEAEDFLKRTRYNFSKRAFVYCHSGCYTTVYRNAYKKAWAERDKNKGQAERPALVPERRKLLTKRSISRWIKN